VHGPLSLSVVGADRKVLPLPAMGGATIDEFDSPSRGQQRTSL
jgi:hypothetical protein